MILFLALSTPTINLCSWCLKSLHILVKRIPILGQLTPFPATWVTWTPPAQTESEEEDVLEPTPLLLQLLHWLRASFLGTRGRRKPRPPCHTHGPDAASGALFWLAHIASVLSAMSLVDHCPPLAQTGSHSSSLHPAWEGYPTTFKSSLCSIRRLRSY